MGGAERNEEGGVSLRKSDIAKFFSNLRPPPSLKFGLSVFSHIFSWFVLAPLSLGFTYELLLILPLSAWSDAKSDLFLSLLSRLGFAKAWLLGTVLINASVCFFYFGGLKGLLRYFSWMWADPDDDEVFINNIRRPRNVPERHRRGAAVDEGAAEGEGGGGQRGRLKERIASTYLSFKAIFLCDWRNVSPLSMGEFITPVTQRLSIALILPLFSAKLFSLAVGKVRSDLPVFLATAGLASGDFQLPANAIIERFVFCASAVALMTAFTLLANKESLENCLGKLKQIARDELFLEGKELVDHPSHQRRAASDRRN